MSQICQKADLTDRIFGRLLVCDLNDIHGTHKRWLCLCECGGRAIVQTADLLSGHTRSCGCLRTEKFKEASRRRAKPVIPGERYAHLTILAEAGHDVTTGRQLVKVRCICGKEVVKNWNRIHQSITKSCGCRKFVFGRAMAA